MTTEQIRIRVPKDEANSLKRIADKCGINYTALAAVFLKSALDAVIKNGERLPLPLELEVKAVPVASNEPRQNRPAARR